MALGQQLGKTNIVAWASQEEEEMDASVSTGITLPKVSLKLEQWHGRKQRRPSIFVPTGITLPVGLSLL